MSGFEHYRQELNDLDREIHRYAMICRLDLNEPLQVDAYLNKAHSAWSGDRLGDALHGLLLLRRKVEAEMIELGLQPPPLQP